MVGLETGVDGQLQSGRGRPTCTEVAGDPGQQRPGLRLHCRRGRLRARPLAFMRCACLWFEDVDRGLTMELDVHRHGGL